MRKMMFSNKERNKSTLDSLTKALANRDKSTINPGTVYVPQGGSSNNNNLSGGISDLALGGLKLGKTLWDNYRGGNAGFYNGEAELGGWIPKDSVGKGINNFVYDKPDYGIFGNAANESIMGTAGSGSAVGDAIGSEVGSGLGGMSGGGWLSLGTGLMNGLNKGFNHSDDKEIMGGFGNGIQGFFNVNENDSDVMQGINGTLDGAMKGTAIFPGVGTVIGALLGLGSSFLDDI